MSEIDEIKKILKKHEERILKLEKSLKSKPESIFIDEEKVLVILINNGFFNELKRYKEIVKQLQTNAVFDKKGNYRKALEGLVRDKKLKRKQISHQWGYSK